MVANFHNWLKNKKKEMDGGAGMGGGPTGGSSAPSGGSNGSTGPSGGSSGSEPIGATGGHSEPDGDEGHGDDDHDHDHDHDHDDHKPHRGLGLVGFFGWYGRKTGSNTKKKKECKYGKKSDDKCKKKPK